MDTTSQPDTGADDAPDTTTNSTVTCTHAPGSADGGAPGQWSTPAAASSQVMRTVFTDIYRNNTWGGLHSVSGPGSELAQTDRIIRALPALFRRFNIRSMLDIPCGDFHWMQWVDLAGVDYIGADIVPEIIDHNRTDRATRNVRFESLDLLHDPLPAVDLILCRDCLVHFDFDAIAHTLDNIRASGSRYLLTTTFTGDRTNSDISTGGWRPLALESPPFRWPPPLQIIQEGCHEKGGAYADKALALWRIEDIETAQPQRIDRGFDVADLVPRCRRR